jgi:hypothetical protein
MRNDEFMEPINFEQANKNLLKPEGWTDEQCGSLPVFTDGQQCISLWKMTWGERLSALFFGKVWLYVISGQTQPPVSLLATKQIFGEAKEALQEERNG